MVLIIRLHTTSSVLEGQADLRGGTLRLDVSKWSQIAQRFPATLPAKAFATELCDWF